MDKPRFRIVQSDTCADLLELVGGDYTLALTLKSKDGQMFKDTNGDVLISLKDKMAIYRACDGERYIVHKH